MKSYMKNPVDYRSVEVETEITIRKMTPKEIDQKLHAITKSRRQRIQPSEVAEGDVVMLTVVSDVERFNKKMIPVTIGSFLYSEELEKALVGMKEGETKTVPINGNDVTVTVRSVSRTVYPEPTDEEVQAFAAKLEDIPDVKNAEEYIAYLQNKDIRDQKESAVYELMQTIMDAVLNQSDIQLDEDELEEQYQNVLHEIENEFESDLHKKLEEVSDEEISTYIGVNDRAALEQMLHENAGNILAMILFCGMLQGKDSKDLDPNDPEGIDYSKLEEYVRSIITYKE